MVPLLRRLKFQHPSKAPIIYLLLVRLFLSFLAFLFPVVFCLAARVHISIIARLLFSFMPIITSQIEISENVLLRHPPSDILVRN